jgi:hypothetical protein
VPRPGSEGQGLAEAVEELWSGARFGGWFWTGRTVSAA